jgi:hypothetical protein
MSVEAKVLVKFTVFFVSGKHRDVLPVSGVPIRIIITFFGAFITMSVAIWILSGTSTSSIIFDILVSREQTYTGKKQVQPINATHLLVNISVAVFCSRLYDFRHNLF